MRVSLSPDQITRLIHLLEPGAYRPERPAIDGPLAETLARALAPADQAPAYDGETWDLVKHEPILKCQCFFCGEWFTAKRCYQLGLDDMGRAKVELQDMIVQLLSHIQGRAGDGKHDAWARIESSMLGLAAFSMAARYAITPPGTCATFLALYRSEVDKLLGAYLEPGSAWRCCGCRSTLMPPHLSPDTLCVVCASGGVVRPGR